MPQADFKDGEYSVAQNQRAARSGSRRVRLDQALKQHFPAASWSEIRSLIIAGKVFIDTRAHQRTPAPPATAAEASALSSKRRTEPQIFLQKNTSTSAAERSVCLDPAAELAPESRFELRLDAKPPTARPRAQSGVLRREHLVYVDPNVVVVEKPSGISSVPFEDDAGETGSAKHQPDALNQLVRYLLNQVPNTQPAAPRGSNLKRPTPNRSPAANARGPKAPLGVVQRLDKETSGLIVFTRTLRAKQHLQQQFRQHTVHRRYLALVHGVIQSTTLRSHLVKNRGDGRRGSTQNTQLGREAVTHVRLLETFDEACLVECRLETGRTHQIRIHLSEAGHPLLGERVYARGYQLLPAPRVMLHAAELGFEHPNNGQTLRFESSLPADFQARLAELRAARPSSPRPPALRPPSARLPSPKPELQAPRRVKPGPHHKLEPRRGAKPRRGSK